MTIYRYFASAACLLAVRYGGTSLVDIASRLSHNALVSINIVTQRQARFVPAWVTVLGRVSHLSMEQGPVCVLHG